MRRHGTPSHYQHGCRCDLCTKAQRERMAEYRVTYAGTLAADDPRHGTRNAYSNYACRCRRCTTAHNDACRPARLRRALAGLRPADPRHGTVNGYQHFACRCGPCCAANSAYRRRRYAAEKGGEADLTTAQPN